MKLMPKWFKKAEPEVARVPETASAIAPLPVMGGQIISPSAAQSIAPAPTTPTAPPQGEHDNYAIPSPVTASAQPQPMQVNTQPAVTKIPVQFGSAYTPPAAANPMPSQISDSSTPVASSTDQLAPAVAQPAAASVTSSPAVGMPNGGVVDPAQHNHYQTENPLAALGGDANAGSKN